MIHMPGAPTETTLKCSRAGCPHPACHAITWHNPALHTDGRKKTWLACATHLDFLREFLESRSFPANVTPLTLHVEAGARRAGANASSTEAAAGAPGTSTVKIREATP